MEKDESKKNEMSANAKEFIPKPTNGQGLGSSNQASTINGGTMSYDVNAWPVNPQQPYSTTIPVVNAWFGNPLLYDPSANQQLQQPVIPQQPYIIPQFSYTLPNWQNSYSHVPARAANGGGFRSGNRQSQQLFDQQQLYSQWNNLFMWYSAQGLYPYGQPPTTINEGTLPCGTTYSAEYVWFLYNCLLNQQRQQKFKPIKFMKENLFLEKELPEFLWDNDVFEPSLVLFPYYEETKEFIESFDPGKEFTYKYNDGYCEIHTLPLEKQILWDAARKNYLAQVDKLQGYGTQWQELGDNQGKKGKTKKILEDFVSTYDTSDAVQMSLCFDIYNEGFKECVNDILSNKDIELKEEYKRQKDKYDAFEKTYKEKLEEQENFATFEIELSALSMQKDLPSVEIATTKRILDQGRNNNTSMNLEAQELFYFASHIFKKLYKGENEDDDFMIFFSNYIDTIRNTDKLGEAKDSIAPKLETLKKNMASNFSTKLKAEIIYTVLNGLANALPYKDIIKQIWNGTFLSNCYTKEPPATRSRIKLNLIESTLTGNLVIYKTQELQSALYDYLTTLENTGLTKEELDIRKRLLINTNKKEDLEAFKEKLAEDLAAKKKGSEKKYKINDNALESILSLAVNNGINISLDNEELNSRISNYIRGVKIKNRNNIEALSNIIYTMLYHSDTDTLLKQDNGIIKALKTKLNGIKQEIRKKGINCKPYLFYNVITIDKFMDYYESKKSKRQLLKSVESAEQEIESSAPQSESQIVFDNEYFNKLRENFKKLIQNGSFTFNKGKAIITFIKYYTSKLEEKAKQEQQLNGLRQDLIQLQENTQKKELIGDLISVLEDVSTDEPENSKGGTESRFDTVSRFENCIKGIIEETFKATNKDNIKTQHKIASREVDFYIHFEKDCNITICDNFIIPIKAGTEIVIEADGATHFEKDMLPENLKEAQDAITGKTRERNYEIKKALIDNKDPDSLKERVSAFRDKEDQLLNLAYYLQRFRQRRKHLNPIIDSDSSKKFYNDEKITEGAPSSAINSSGNIPPAQNSTQDTQTNTENSELIQMTKELEDLRNILQNKDVKEVIQDSITKSNLFFSIPLLKADITGVEYPKKEIKKVFLNCFINAYCSQALSNLKEFYRWKAEEEKKELENRRKAEEEKKEAENTKTTQPSRQKQNGDQTTQEGQNGTLKKEPKNTQTTQPSRQKQNGDQTTQEGENGIDPLRGVDNCQTNKKIGGIDALQKIKEARDQEKDKMKPKLDSIPTIRQNTRTSGQGNVLY